MLARSGILGALIVIASTHGVSANSRPGNEPIDDTGCVLAFKLLRDDSSKFASPRNAVADMDRQPITGKPVVRSLTGMTKAVRVCTSKRLPSGVEALYERVVRRVIVHEKGIQPSSMAHEAFHFHQDQAGAYRAIDEETKLTPRDGAVALLLIEATAVAYSVAVGKEAMLNDGAATRRKLPNPFGMAGTFERAFATAHAAAADLPESRRRSIALEQGGQAVTRALMAGNSGSWRRFYRKQAQLYVQFAAQNDGRISGYAALRDDLHGRIGRVTDGLSMLPPEYTGAQADGAIAAAADRFDIAPSHGS